MSQAPAWFERALAVPRSDGFVEVEGASVHYLAWGEPGRRGLVFVHGGGAHAHWWTHVAARFADQFRVVAIDLSGHGDSDHRDVYAIEQWTREVLAVAAHAEIGGRPVVVGHSMGGMVTIVAAALHPDAFTGVIICDSPVTEPDAEVESYRLREAFGRPRTYASVEEARARYRTVPPQEHTLPYVIDNVVAHSMRPAEGGFQWKFDRHVFEQFGGSIRGVAKPYLPEVRCRFALLRSENGLVTPTIGAEMYEELGRVAPVIELPQAGHHAMLDEPLVLLAAIRTLLADWDHSDPFSRPSS
jgi:pimeloyl-ACP methyl ester carboxylesterase